MAEAFAFTKKCMTEIEPANPAGLVTDNSEPVTGEKRLLIEVVCFSNERCLSYCAFASSKRCLHTRWVRQEREDAHLGCPGERPILLVRQLCRLQSCLIKALSSSANQLMQAVAAAVSERSWALNANLLQGHCRKYMAYLKPVTLPVTFLLPLAGSAGVPEAHAGFLEVFQTMEDPPKGVTALSQAWQKVTGEQPRQKPPSSSFLFILTARGKVAATEIYF